MPNKKRSSSIHQVPQTDSVMDYMKVRGALTAAAASSVLGVSRLAAVILRLKKKGVEIETKYVSGFRGRYAEYSLAT